MTEGSEVLPVSTIQMTRETNRISMRFQKPGASAACLGYREEPALFISGELKHKHQQSPWAFVLALATN